MGRFSVLAAMLLAIAAGCGSEDSTGAPAPGIAISSPLDGSEVMTFEFQVEAQSLAPDLSLATFTATLNGRDLPLEVLADRVRARVVAGPPLLDDNELRFAATRTDGSPVSATSHFHYLPPKARAVRIDRPEQLLRGPMAQNQIGDYLLSNGVARFVVQDVGKRQFANVGTYGGDLIDAELVGDPGRDNFFEIAPMVNIETVINAQRVEIVNDGQDGTAAIVRTCGPDDVLDFINPSASVRGLVGVSLPATIDDADYDVEGCTDYVLEPAVAHVQMTTTIFNNESHSLGLFVGDLVAGAGSLDPWEVSTRNRNGVGEVLTLPITALSLIGFDDSEGQDYQYVPVPLPGSPIPTSDVLAISGVYAILHSHSVVQAIAGAAPTFVIPAKGSNSYTRHFGIGQGSGANAINLVNEVMGISTATIHGCVTVGGAPAPLARVAVGPTSNGALTDVVTHFVADSAGCFEGTLVPGNYGAVAGMLGTPFENNAATPPVHSFSVAAGATAELSFDLPPPAHLHVHVTDEHGTPMPGRITLVGFDSSPDPHLLTPILADTATTYLFRDLDYDGRAFGVAGLGYAGADGNVELTAKPGEYWVAISRGTEFSLFSQRVDLTSGVSTEVSARLARVLDTAGYVSSDFHVHGLSSTDSRTSSIRRVSQYAGEGTDNIVMTDHHGRTDLKPTIHALSLDPFITATIGEEITTGDYGHYNGYPFDLVPGHQTGGAVDWGRPAPPGRDFVAYGAYTMTPAELDAEAHSAAGHRDSTVVQANHVDSYYGPLKIDSSAVPPRSFIDNAEKLALRLDPNTPNLFHAFAAMEIWNGYERRHQDKFFDSHSGIWFNLLNQGILTTGTAVTDTHGYNNLNAAGPRTWTPSPTDDPREIDPDQVARSIAAGKATVGQGAFLEVRVHAADGSGKHAGHGLDENTLVATSNGDVELEVRVQSPVWAGVDTIRVYANAETFPTGQVGGVNYQFSAHPTLELHAGADFAVERVTVRPDVANGARFEANLSIPIRGLTEDTWFVVTARGSDGVSHPMFPVAAGGLSSSTNHTVDDLMDGNLGEGGVLALAISNPLYADVDGVEGFQAPLTLR